MKGRSTSVGSFLCDEGRLPPRSPLSSLTGQRTPPTCPASPLLVGKVALPPVSAGTRSTGDTPVRARPRSVPCKALPPVDLSHSRVLSNIVSSVFESNLTAEQCFSTYGRMHAAPPLVGMSHIDGGGHTHPAAAASASATGIVHAARPAHTSAGAATGLDGFGSLITNDINEVDFGLATCLATPMDPGPGPERERRLAQLPATTTAAARSATYKLTSANDILQETSRYGDWVRRQGRRRKLERMQGLLAELGANAVLGRLIDDTLLGTESVTRKARRHDVEYGVDGVGVQEAADAQDCGSVGAPVPPCSASGPGESRGLGPGTESRGRASNAEDFPARHGGFRDDMAIMS